MSGGLEFVKRAVVGGLVGALFGGSKQQEQPQPQKQIVSDPAKAAATQRDLMAKRKGAAANELTGALGAESTAGGKKSLGQ